MRSVPYTRLPTSDSKTATAYASDSSDYEGENSKKQVLYVESSGTNKVRRATCTKSQACIITAIVLLALLIIAFVASFARPFLRCSFVIPDQEIRVSTPKVSQTIPLSTTGELFPWTDVRLPPFVMPLHYDLFMHPNLTTFENSGSVNITFQVTAETDFIVLHIKELNLSRTVVLEGSQKEISVIQRLEYSKYEQLYIRLGNILEPLKNYTLWIDFKRRLEEKLEGFYISSYKTSDGQKRYLATTHFEPTYARHAFPCFDEPAMKATFKLAVVHSESYKAFFNAEVAQSAPYGNGLTITVFDNTLRMSTYLVAIIVCDFKEVRKLNEDGVKIGVIVPSEQQSAAQFAVETAAQVLHFYQMFFNISYPLPKLDMIAIPDFGPGAMENWGLVTYRMTAILYNPSETSTKSQQNVAAVIAHELAHQWFGNYVTMEWWSDLWLNEGFATFVEFIGVNYIKPDWNMMDQFITSITQEALALDSLENSHPIMTEVNDPMEIESIFDSVSYKKGAAILYMLENFLGFETMKKGLTNYLNKYSYRNARTEDLWNAFSEVAVGANRLNVSRIMDTWTKQKGYPLLMVEHKDRIITIRQKRFLLSPTDQDVATPADLSPYGYKWYIPVTYKTDSMDGENIFWLNMTDGQFFLPKRITWLKVNVNQTGFYRVMYDTDMWKTLIDVMRTNHEMLHPADRANLLDDALTLSRVGILDSHLAMNLTRYLENERNYVVWDSALLQMNLLYMLMYDSPGLHLYQRYMVKLLKPLVQSLRWEDEGNHLTKKLRSLALSSAVNYNDAETVNRAKELFKRWMKDGEKIAPDFRHVVYGAGIKYGGREEWQYCWKRYQETQVASEKRVLLSALGSTCDIWQLSQYLNYSLDKNKIRPQDTTLVISVVASNPNGRLLVWRFLRMNWPLIIKMFGQGSFSLDHIISQSISHFSTQFDLNEVTRFFSGTDVASGIRALQQSMERIKTNIRWRQNTEASIIQWLQHIN